MSVLHRAPRRVAALAGCAVLVTTAVACSSSAARSAIPSFQAAAGRFRVVPQPTAGAPPPQILQYGGHRLLASLIDVHGSGDAARARLGLRLSDEEVVAPTRDYRAGETVRVGTVQVHVDGVYGSGEKNIAVDITLS